MNVGHRSQLKEQSYQDLKIVVSTVKPVLRGHSKIDKMKILMTNGSLMKVEKYCKMLLLEHSAIFLTCIK